MDSSSLSSSSSSAAASGGVSHPPASTAGMVSLSSGISGAAYERGNERADGGIHVRHVIGGVGIRFRFVSHQTSGRVGA